MSPIYRFEQTERNPPEGPFGHLDVRWTVGDHTGASLIALLGRPCESIS